MSELIPELSNLIKDPDLRTRYEQSIQEILTIAQTLPRENKRALIQQTWPLIARNIPCTACNGSGQAPDVVAVLLALQRPAFLTPTMPGKVPSQMLRWVCRCCPGKMSVFSHTRDLRRHLRDYHDFTSEGVDDVFKTRRSDNRKLWEYFGPCTVDQGRGNGWDFTPWATENRSVSETMPAHTGQLDSNPTSSSWQNPAATTQSIPSTGHEDQRLLPPLQDPSCLQYDEVPTQDFDRMVAEEKERWNVSVAHGEISPIDEPFMGWHNDGVVSPRDLHLEPEWVPPPSSDADTMFS